MATKFEILRDQDFPVLVVEGELSQNELRPFDAALDELAAQEGQAAVVDLMACPFITSLTVPCLLRAHDEAKQTGRRLYIAAGEELQMVLRVLRLETRLHLRPSREAGLADAASEPPTEPPPAPSPEAAKDSGEGDAAAD